MYRLLALDLDGTLLRADQRIDDDDLAAIAELQADGVAVTIITGRLHSGALAAARTCAIGGAIACVEGSHLVDLASDRTLAHHPIDAGVGAAVRRAMGTPELSTFVFDAAGIHHDHGGAPYASYIRTWSPNLRLVEEELAWPTSPLAVVAIGDHDAVAAAHAALRDDAVRVFTVTFAVSTCPGKSALLVRAAGPSKGTALIELCRIAGCSAGEAVVVGDWMNDVPMFEVAGRSFAMGGAPDAVASKATDVLVRVAGSGGGIAEAVRRAWG